MIPVQTYSRTNSRVRSLWDRTLFLQGRRLTLIRCQLALLVFSLLILSPLASAQPAAGGPNIVLILADDLGYGDVGVYGAEGLQTPNIDRLASEGVMLTDFYSAPVCGPSRAMLMTGAYPPRVSLNRNHTPSARTGIHPDALTLGEVLQQAGYATAIFGKWHLGDHYQFRPLRHGFDEYVGIPYSNDMWPFHPRTRETPGEDPRLTAARERAELTGYPGSNRPFRLGEEIANLPLYDGDTIVEFNADQTLFGSIFVDEALDFIERHQSGPFFAYVALTAPHVPLHPAPEFLGTSSRDLYGDTVHEIDHGVGRILAKLTELGIDQETLVLFISDNGPWLGYGIDGGSPGILSGGKGSQFEGGIRVPALMRWPGELTAGAVVAEPLGLVDILPTLAALSGVSPEPGYRIDGVNFWPLVTGQVSGPLREALFSFKESTFADADLGAIRSGQWKLHVDTSGGTVSATALYDLSTDIGETTDVKSSRSGLVASLESLGEALIADIYADQQPLGFVVHTGEPFSQKTGSGELISVEAENYHLQEARSGHSWDEVSIRHSAADLSLQALPNTGTNIDSGYVTASPHLEFRISADAPGRYYAWVRARGDSRL